MTEPRQDGRGGRSVVIQECDLPLGQPLLLGPGDGVELAMSAARKADVLPLLTPGRDLRAELEERTEDDEWWDVADWEHSPIDAGNIIDGAPWGWFRAGDGWKILPVAFQDEAEELVTAGAWQSASMTGIVIGSGCRLSETIAVSWLADDIDGTQFLDVTYGVDDRAAAASDALAGAFYEWEPFCVACDDQGWEVTISPSESLPPEVVGKAMALFWVPCDLHASDSDAWCVEMAGTDWRWTEGRWGPN
ncbi:MAG TPA: hypothetical protein VNY84_07685 [Acidimicrobiales bacterium]|jgi:hypothetical protein|nr:hypothetical protein [Acidimicrobiales bacterium]